MTRLIAGSDAFFGWMLGGPAPMPGLKLPPGGIEEPATLEMLRGLAERIRSVHGRGDWLIVVDDEVVGMCSYIKPVDAEGVVEIGYGIAASRRGRHHATRGVAIMLEEMATDPLVRSVSAGTATANIASQRVLEANGFERTGTRIDPEDGEVIVWRRDLP